MNKENLELHNPNSEIERLKSELLKKDSEIRLLKTEIAEKQKEADDERNAMMYMLEDANESAAEMEESNKRLNNEIEINTHLLMIAEAVANTTDIDRLMEQVIECAYKITGCDICLSYIWDEGREEFIPSHSMGLTSSMVAGFRTTPIKIEMVIIVEAFANRSAAISSGKREIIEVEEKLQWINDINTVAVIPLFGKDKYLGMIISIYNTKKPEITERLKKVMVGIGHQVSVSLEQARLYRETIDKSMELSHKIETIQVMNEIDRSILSSLKSQEILEAVTMMIGRMISCDMASVVIVDREKKGFIYSAGFGVSFVQKGAVIPFESTSITDVLKTGRYQYIANFKEIKGMLHCEEMLLRDGCLSHIRIPLVVKNEIVGVLSLGSKRPSAFTPEDLLTLEKLTYQLGVALQNARQLEDIKRSQEETNEAFIYTINALARAGEANDEDTGNHILRVGDYCMLIATKMGLSNKFIEDIRLEARLHDIGKTHIHPNILRKPGKLTDEEWKIMKSHPYQGAKIIGDIHRLMMAKTIAYCHHERWDGGGYPRGLIGEKIPLEARIISIADQYDALRSERSYKPAFDHDKTCRIILEGDGRTIPHHFDPQVHNTFREIASEFEACYEKLID